MPVWLGIELQEGGILRSIIHYKDYEPMFEHYGAPPYIAGMDVSAIASQNKDDWQSLHDQTTSDIVAAHSWFRALSGLDYSIRSGDQHGFCGCLWMYKIPYCNTYNK